MVFLSASPTCFFSTYTLLLPCISQLRSLYPNLRRRVSESDGSLLYISSLRPIPSVVSFQHRQRYKSVNIRPKEFWDHAELRRGPRSSPGLSVTRQLHLDSIKSTRHIVSLETQIFYTNTNSKMLRRRPRLWAVLLCLFLCIQLATARPAGLVRRQDEVSPEPTLETTPRAPEPTKAVTDAPKDDEEPTPVASTKPTDEATPTTSETSAPTPTESSGIDDLFDCKY